MPNWSALPIIKQILSMTDKWMGNTSQRRTVRALEYGRLGFLRAIKLYPEIKNDKTFHRYFHRFMENVTKN